VGGVLLNKSQTTLIVYPAGKTGSYTIPNSVTSIGNNGASIQGWAFARCTSLTSVTIPDSVTNIGDVAFYDCTSLTNVAIPNSVTTIRGGAFQSCAGLMSVTIGNSVASIGNSAFEYCGGLTRVCFQGNAPSLGGSFVFDGDNNATVYYLPGTTGWGPTFGGRPTALWTEVPTIQTPPQTQTAEAGSAVCLWAQATNALPLFYLWYFNGTNFLSCSTNCELDMTNVLFGQSGAYTMVFSNVLGAVTSLPAMLNVIPPVERRPVPGINLAGDSGSMLNLDYADSLSPAPNWSTLDSVALTGTSELYFDLTKPLPPLRFYRVWQTGTPAVAPSLTLPAMIPAITLTGNIGDKLRLDCINQYGPTDAWVTLDTITLTNTSQLYFDVSAPGQPQRLYRIVPVP